MSMGMGLKTQGTTAGSPNEGQADADSDGRGDHCDDSDADVSLMRTTTVALCQTTRRTSMAMAWATCGPCALR